MAREHRKKSESDQEDIVKHLVSVNRVSKVVKGGKRFSFSALIVVGDKRGRAGYGSGKAREASDAVRKATDQAVRSMVRVYLKEGRTIHYDTTASYGAGLIHMRRAPQGTGIIAGDAMRAVFDALGIQDIVAKSFRSTNPHNVIKATFKALLDIKSPRIIAQKRNKRISDLFYSSVQSELAS